MCSLNIDCGCCKVIAEKVTDWAFEFCGKHASYVYSLGTNLEKLKKARDDLKPVMDRVIGLVETAEQRGEQRTSDVEQWFENVATQRAEAIKLQEEGERACEKLPCTVKVCPIYIVGVKIVSMTDKLSALKRDGDGYKEEEVASSSRWFTEENSRRRGKGDPNKEYATVGNLEADKEEVLRYLEGPGKSIVGVYGRGGVGKTKLLRLINEHYNTNADLVIYVQVKDLSVEQIQKAIREKMKFLNNWRHESVAERAYYISKVLQQQQQQNRICVLLLDDVRKTSYDNIQDIVGNDPDHRFKVVFTTRNKEVSKMAEKTVRVETLKEKDGRVLFEKAAEINKSASLKIRRSVAEVVRLCGGLPFALVKLGEELVGKNHEEWMDMISFLRNPAPRDVMANILFKDMKYSYDNLPGADCQECFLYSCVFLPVKSYIPACELEELWIYGDCSTHFSKRKDPRVRAREIKRILVDESLLEETDKGLKMHNVVRGMGLWLASEDTLVIVGDSSDAGKNWGGKKRVLMRKNELGKLAELPKDACRNLRTLSVTKNGAPCKMSDKLFNVMDALAVLNLSHSDVNQLPLSISGLRSLKYLDISCTKITKLPKLMKYLDYLNVNGLSLEIDRSKRVISELSCLQVLRMLCRYSYVKKKASKLLLGKDEEEHVLEELKSLGCLNMLEIEVGTSSTLDKLFSTYNYKLLKKMRCLSIRGFKTGGGCVVKLSQQTGKLVELLVTKCYFKELFIMVQPSSPTNYTTSFNNITKVTVDNCHKLVDLTCLVSLEVLQILKVSSCAVLTEIVSRKKLPPKVVSDDDEEEGMQESLFCDLTHLYLHHLPALEFIYECRHSEDLPESELKFPRSLPLKLLCELQVYECPKLKKLPFGANSIDDEAKKIQLHAEPTWWKEIDWEGNDARHDILRRFDRQPLPPLKTKKSYHCSEVQCKDSKVIWSLHAEPLDQ